MAMKEGKNSKFRNRMKRLISILIHMASILMMILLLVVGGVMLITSISNSILINRWEKFHGVSFRENSMKYDRFYLCLEYNPEEYCYCAQRLPEVERIKYCHEIEPGLHADEDSSNHEKLLEAKDSSGQD